MVGFIAILQKEAPWEAGDVGSSSWIMMGSLNILEKAWWTLGHNRLSITYGDNVLIPDKAALVMGIMEGYEIDIAKLIERKIYH